MFKKRILTLAAALTVLAGSVFADVTVKKDAGGWRMFDDNTPVEVKGIVWSYTPIGETHTYDLFSKDDAFIMRMIDTDMPMLKTMGVNAIRCFSTIPPKWVEYIYNKYGIYTIINDLLGRYGVTVNGTWYAQTDYSDYYTQQTLIGMARATAERYKDVKGVLMYMFGNESNYGLVWSSSEIEDLPVGEQHVVKAGYLYDVLEKSMKACKEIDPARPVGFINGDVQYLDLIAKLCPSLDILGVNAYRGYKFYDSFYENVRDVLDKPVVFTESGADAFNDILRQEDQFAQMTYLRTQWQEIYEQAYGKGKCQNVLGGFVFEWMDEWWKRYQNKNLTEHDEASWSNAGYDMDYQEGVNNMSEEWFGICAQSPIMKNGINVRIPRAAYYMLCDAWKLSIYDSTNQQIAAKFASMPYAEYLAKGNEKSIKQTLNEMNRVKISQMNGTVKSTTPVFVNKLVDAVNNGTPIKDCFEYVNEDGDINKTTVVAEATLGFKAQPSDNFMAEVVVKGWTGEELRGLGDNWGMYYENYHVTKAADDKKAQDKRKYFDVYSAEFAYTNPMFDLNGFYHTGHAGFEGKGDPFWISKEAYDIIGYDTNGDKGPVALQFIGKGALSGLEVIGGPEIWGYSAPQIQANYFKWVPLGSNTGLNLNATYAEEFGSKSLGDQDPYNVYGPGRKASVFGEFYYDPWVKIKAAFLHAGSEKVGAKYTDAKTGGQKLVTYADTIGAYLSVGTEMFQHSYIYTNVIYRGLVADTNAAMVRGSFFTGDSGSGNRFEFQLGADLGYGNFVLKPVFRARVPLQDPAGRNLINGSPFVVGLGNRQAVEAEFVFTYDPEGATWFHEWNSNDIEGANFAMSLTGFYQLMAGETDNLAFKSNDPKQFNNTITGVSTYDKQWYDGGSLGRQSNLWQIGTRVVTNLVPNLRLIGTANVGRQCATTGAYKQEYVTFFNVGLAARYKHFIGTGNVAINSWGPETWWRDFNITFPLQYTLDVAYSFTDKPLFAETTNRIGLKLTGRLFDANGSDPYGALPKNAAIDGAHYFEISTYCSIGL